MPSFIKTRKDEKYWNEAKDIAEETYGKGKHKNDDKFWGTVTNIWKRKKKKHDKPYKKKRKKHSSYDTNSFWNKLKIF